MSRESNDHFVCPACDTVIYREECACEPLDDLQATLAAAYSVYLHNATRNLIGFVYRASPLVGVRKVL